MSRGCWWIFPKMDKLSIPSRPKEPVPDVYAHAFVPQFLRGVNIAPAVDIVTPPESPFKLDYTRYVQTFAVACFCHHGQQRPATGPLPDIRPLKTPMIRSTWSSKLTPPIITAAPSTAISVNRLQCWQHRSIVTPCTGFL
jgi:hypothetical protein